LFIVGNLLKIVDSIRNIEQALGNGVKAPMESEVGISQVVLKRILASRAIQCGEELTAENLCVKRNDQGIPAKYWDLLLGKKASRAYAADEPVDL
jgi:sialic acid synthase SpsE